WVRGGGGDPAATGRRPPYADRGDDGARPGWGGREVPGGGDGRLRAQAGDGGAAGRRGGAVGSGRWGWQTGRGPRAIRHRGAARDRTGPARAASTDGWPVPAGRTGSVGRAAAGRGARGCARAGMGRPQPEGRQRPDRGDG